MSSKSRKKPTPSDRPAPLVIAVTVGSESGRYDHMCLTCGRRWEEHRAECPRHEYRPAWVTWLERNPDPRVDPATDDETVRWWQARSADAGVPGTVWKGTN